jgi:hypothetical protein
MAGMELNRPFLVIQIPFSFLKSPLGRILSKKIHFSPLSASLFRGSKPAFGKGQFGIPHLSVTLGPTGSFA